MQKGFSTTLVLGIITIIILPMGWYIVTQRQAGPTLLPISEPTPQIARITTPIPSPNLPKIIELAKDDLAKKLNIDLSKITIKSMEVIQWSDSSLDCPEPGKMYLQVITPGYKVIFSYQGEQYEYHTNQTSFFVTCKS